MVADTSNTHQISINVIVTYEASCPIPPPPQPESDQAITSLQEIQGTVALVDHHPECNQKIQTGKPCRTNDLGFFNKTPCKYGGRRRFKSLRHMNCDIWNLSGFIFK